MSTAQNMSLYRKVLDEEEAHTLIVRALALVRSLEKKSDPPGELYTATEQHLINALANLEMSYAGIEAEPF